jgi:hypothetical protein
MNDRKRGRREPDQAADGGSARYGRSSGAKGSGHQESKKPERKDAAGFKSRQGGDQSRGGSGKGGDGDRSKPDARAETEEAARTGRFPDRGGTVRDDSNPVEPEGESDGFDRGVGTEHVDSPSQGVRPEEVPDRES